MRKYIALVPAILFGKMLFAQFAADSVFTHVEQMPYFFGCAELWQQESERRKCSDEEMVGFISQYLVYPETAKEEGVQGTVYVSFTVDEDGQVQAPNVLVDIGAGCGEAALDVISQMPAWAPGLQNGRPVKVKLNLPIQFYLRAEERDRSERFSLNWGGLRGETVTTEQLTEALAHAVNVRGPEGDIRFVDELEFYFEKKGRTVAGAGRGGITAELQKVVERARPGGTFTIRASVQEGGKFVPVLRSFTVVK